MIKNLLLYIVKFISFIPFIKTLLKIFYIYGEGQLKKRLVLIPDILDVLIISDTRSKDFNYGQSDYNLLVIAKNNSPLRRILRNLRLEIKGNLLTSLVFNSNYIPILTEDEVNSDIIRSYLIRSNSHKSFSWRSMITRKTFAAPSQNQKHFSALLTAFKNLDFYLFRNHHASEIRIRVKNIYRSMRTLEAHFPSDFHFSNSFRKKALFIINYPLFSRFLFQSLFKDTWNALVYKPHTTKVPKKKEILLPQEISEHLKELLHFDFIEDITLTPSIIQGETKTIKGKVFIEIHVNQHITKNKYLAQIRNLKDGIKSFQTSDLKIRTRILTQNILRIQMEECFYQFPLESLYRKYETVSLNSFSYDFGTSLDSINQSSIHFLISQFMRFRSLEQKSDLIGSKFVKSLNLMFRYYQLLHYLKHKKFLNYRIESEIRQVLSPQFSRLKLRHEVKDKDWPLIKSQLLYLLKKIRIELIKVEPSLKDFKF